MPEDKWDKFSLVIMGITTMAACLMLICYAIDLWYEAHNPCVQEQAVILQQK